MPTVPFRPNYQSLGRTDAGRRSKAVAHNQLIDRILAFTHRAVLDNPDELQVIRFGEIAVAMGLDKETVANAFLDGGGNGITIRVTAEDRQYLKRRLGD